MCFLSRAPYFQFPSGGLCPTLQSILNRLCTVGKILQPQQMYALNTKLTFLEKHELFQESYLCFCLVIETRVMVMEKAKWHWGQEVEVSMPFLVLLDFLKHFHESL